MNFRENYFSKAASVVNSLLIFVVVLYMIETIYARSVYMHVLWLGLLAAIPFKIYCHAGIYGCLVEIVSGQEMVLKFSRFHANAVRYMWLYAGVLASLYAVNFFLFCMIPSFSAVSAFKFFYPYVGIFVALGLAYAIITDKYLKPQGIQRRSIQLNAGDFRVILGLFAVECVLSWLPAFFPATTFDWPRFTTLALKYIYLLQFVYFCFLIFDAYREVPEQFEKSHQIYLVNPCSSGVIDGIAMLFQMTYPPFFVVLKALTPKTYGFREFNRIFWRERYYKSGKLVAITSFTAHCAEAYEIAKEFRKRGSKVVMGGPHVTYLPDEALDYCDSVVIGEAEGVWKDVIRDFENNELKPKYMGAAVEDFYAEVHQELLISPPHVIKDFLETTRGCKFRCHFCTIPSLSGGKARKKPVAEIVELIQKIKHKYKSIMFIDNNIYSDPAYAKELFQALIPLKVKWRTQCTIDIAKNTETLALAKESGCDQFLFGYEIFGGSLEKQQGGKFAMAQNYIRYTDIIKKMGIKIKAHFIFGFDSDNFWNLPRLWKFCFDILPSWTVISMLTPLPGSRLYHEMLDENRIISMNWRNYAMHDLVVRHPRMNSQVASFLFPYIRLIFLLTTSIGGITLLSGVCIVSFFEMFLRSKGVVLF
jgi:hypothetical protein